MMCMETTIFFFVGLVSVIYATDKKCGTTSFTLDSENTCSEIETCDENTKTCQCLPDFDRINDTCVPKPKPAAESNPNYSSLVDNQGSGSIVAGILIPLTLIALVICGLYVTRKYKLVAWVRNKLHRGNENYDEFMIGQDLDDDDPPLH